jgi:hypothetical protein
MLLIQNILQYILMQNVLLFIWLVNGDNVGKFMK